MNAQPTLLKTTKEFQLHVLRLAIAAIGDIVGVQLPAGRGQFVEMISSVINNELQLTIYDTETKFAIGALFTIVTSPGENTIFPVFAQFPNTAQSMLCEDINRLIEFLHEVIGINNNLVHPGDLLKMLEPEA